MFSLKSTPRGVNSFQMYSTMGLKHNNSQNVPVVVVPSNVQSSPKVKKNNIKGFKII